MTEYSQRSTALPSTCCFMTVSFLRTDLDFVSPRSEKWIKQYPGITHSLQAKMDLRFNAMNAGSVLVLQDLLKFIFGHIQVSKTIISDLNKTTQFKIVIISWRWWEEALQMHWMWLSMRFSLWPRQTRANTLASVTLPQLLFFVRCDSVKAKITWKYLPYLQFYFIFQQSKTR